MKLNKPMIVYKKDLTNQKYAELAIYCNQNNCHIEDKGKYLTSVKNKIVEKTYKEKRREEYPPFEDYLDAIVKINSKDEAFTQEGKTQLETYIADCLAVKEKYPKPTVNNPSTVEEEVVNEPVKTEMQEETIDLHKV